MTAVMILLFFGLSRRDRRDHSGYEEGLLLRRRRRRGSPETPVASAT